MASAIQFETPENIEVSYAPAGLGTRFVAWLVDYILMVLLVLCMCLLLLCTGALSHVVMGDTLRRLERFDPQQLSQLPLYFAGLMMLVFGLGSFVYYGLSELLMHGQTLGKRHMGLRVVKVDGFSLTPASILIRNVFRVADHIPLLWIVPLVSARAQRLGDMVAGTVVVADNSAGVGTVRTALAGRSAAEAKFRFDGTALAKARPQDVAAVEKLLQRWSAISELQRADLLRQMVPPLAQRLGVEAPPPAEAQRFLEDFLAAEYRRQYRKLG